MRSSHRLNALTAALTMGAGIGMALTPPSVIADTMHMANPDRKSTKRRDTKAFKVEKNRKAAKAARQARKKNR